MITKDFDRRRFIKSVGLLTGSALVVPSVLLADTGTKQIRTARRTRYVNAELNALTNTGIHFDRLSFRDCHPSSGAPYAIRFVDCTFGPACKFVDCSGFEFHSCCFPASMFTACSKICVASSRIALAVTPGSETVCNQLDLTDSTIMSNVFQYVN